MNHFMRIILGFLCILLSINLSQSQNLIFSGDTVVLASCENIIQSIDTLQVYNNTDEDIELEWNLTEYYFPHDGFYTLIIDPAQYPPFTPHGHVELTAHDTTDIIFYMWNDTLVPGDTSFFQINVYDQSDSASTHQLLTAIQYCPVATRVVNPGIDQRINVFPNPAYGTSAISISCATNLTSIHLYSIQGETVMRFPVSGKEIRFSIEGLEAGVYILQAMQNEKLIGTTRLVLNDQ